MNEPEASERREIFLLRVIDDRVAFAAVIGSLGVIAGSALTWSVVPTAFGSISESGLAAGGKLTVLAGALALVFLLASLRLQGRDLPVLAALTSLAASGVAVAYLFDLRAASARVVARLLEGRGSLDPALVQSTVGARAGAGVWLVIVAGVAVAVASAVLLFRTPATER